MSVEPVPQEMVSESQSPDQQALDAIARLHAEKQELEREGYAKVRPGANEADALGNVAITAFGWGWLGTALAGACFGTLAFPLLGTIAGFFIAGIVSLLPCMFASMLYVMSRGRISAILGGGRHRCCMLLRRIGERRVVRDVLRGSDRRHRRAALDKTRPAELPAAGRIRRPFDTTVLDLRSDDPDRLAGNLLYGAADRDADWRIGVVSNVDLRGNQPGVCRSD